MMFKQLFALGTIVAFLMTSAVSEAQTPGNPPKILIASGIDAQDRLELVRYQTIYIGFQGDAYNHRTLDRVDLAKVTITDLSGSDLSIDEARTRLGDREETPVLVMSHREELGGVYKSLFKKEMIIFRFKGKSPEWKAIEDPDMPVK